MGDDGGANHVEHRLLAGNLDRRPRAGHALNGLTASAIVHAAALIAALLLASRPQESRPANAPRAPQENLIWTMAAGPGGGGGGGGNRRSEPPQVAERPGGEDRTAPVVPSPSPTQADPEPAREQRLSIPVIATAAGLNEVPGVLTSMTTPVAGSRGPGSGPGAGSGRRSGIGGGDGDGLDDGIGGGTGGDVYEPGSGVSMPRVVYEPRPGYTSQAMHAKIQGVVVMEAVVQPDGTVGSVQVTRSLDSRFGLDQEAVRTIREWRFLPGMRGNKPVAVRVAIEMTFTLR